MDNYKAIRKELNQIVSEIISKQLVDLPLIKIISELKSFISLNGGDDFLVDDDLEYLCTIAVIYNKQSEDQLISLTKLINTNVLYKRIGPILTPLTDTTHKTIIDRISQSICKIHLDLFAYPNKRGVSFIDDKNAVISLQEIRRVENMPYEYSCSLTIYNIKSLNQLTKVIDKRYINEKKWAFVGKQNRCVGKYFVITEILDILHDRKIITFHPYE